MTRIVTRTAIALAAVVVAASAGCGAARTAAATQPAPAAFDPSKSDPKAVAIADEVIAALGGEANWHKAHEIQWGQAIVVDGKLVDLSNHSWDRWNGRHHFERVDPNGKMGSTMYDMFGEARGFAFVGGQKVVVADRDKMIAEAKKRFDTDSYPLTLPYKLKDPGVHLKYSEERPEEGAKHGAPMKYDVLQITFDDGVGTGAKDTWYISVDKQTHVPDHIEHVAAGKSDNERSGFTLEEWTEAGGLKFATVRKTLGYTKADAPTVAVTFPKEWKDVVPPKVAGFKAPTPGEVILIDGIKVNAEPTEEDYIPKVE